MTVAKCPDLDELERINRQVLTIVNADEDAATALATMTFLDVIAYTRQAEAALVKINDIRNSIIGLQNVNWSEHIYPLVAALNEVGIVGLDYPEARRKYGTMLERLEDAVCRVCHNEVWNPGEGWLFRGNGMVTVCRSAFHPEAERTLPPVQPITRDGR